MANDYPRISISGAHFGIEGGADYINAEVSIQMSETGTGLTAHVSLDVDDRTTFLQIKHGLVGEAFKQVQKASSIQQEDIADMLAKGLVSCVDRPFDVSSIDFTAHEA